MRNWVQFLFVVLAGLALFGLTGCESEMRVVASSNNPGEIGGAVVGIFVIWAVVLYIFSSHGLANSMIYGARYTAILVLILTPFQFAAGNISMALALLAFGVIGLCLPNIMALTKPKKSKVIVKREGPADEAEERLRIAEERLEQQEARLNRQERRQNGDDTPFR